MVKPVHIFVGKRELLGYTSMSLTREKTDMTGQLNVTLFMGYMPNEAVLDGIIRGEEILVYVAGDLAFTGVIDRRTGKGSKSDKKKSDEQSGASLNVGPDQYTVQITARGKTKALVDSSHQSQTTLLNQTNRTAIETLVAPWGIIVDWDATEIDIGRVRFEDGATVFEEIQRLSETTGLYVYESRDGRMRITDKPVDEIGEPIVLGRNILSFSTDQLGDQERSQILVKGQRTAPDTFGELAVLPTFKNVVDGATRSFSPVTVQLYGDATPELIERATLYEANKQASLSKRIEVDVFHVQQTSGTPWDLAGVHFVEIPPEGVVGHFEIVKLEYKVDADRTLKTRLTLAPPQVAPVSTKDEILSDITVAQTSGSGRAAILRVGDLAGSWLGAQLTDVVTEIETVVEGLLEDVQEASAALPPLKLPAGFMDGLDE